MNKPIATVIRENLPQGVWEKGFSRTYRDTHYSKTRATTRWAAKDLNFAVWDQADQAKTKQKLQDILGKEYDVCVGSRDVLVYKTDSIKIVKV